MDNFERAKEWLKFAEMDLRSAEHLLKMRPVPPLEVICYHCQQAAEKYLSAYLVLHGQRPPKTHDLDLLCKRCLKISNKFHKIEDECSDLTAYGIHSRYPFRIELEQSDMHRALNNIRTIRDVVHKLAPELFHMDQPTKTGYREMLAINR